MHVNICETRKYVVKITVNGEIIGGGDFPADGGDDSPADENAARPVSAFRPDQGISQYPIHALTLFASCCLRCFRIFDMVAKSGEVVNCGFDPDGVKML